MLFTTATSNTLHCVGLSRIFKTKKDSWLPFGGPPTWTSANSYPAYNNCKILPQNQTFSSSLHTASTSFSNLLHHRSLPRSTPLFSRFCSSYSIKTTTKTLSSSSPFTSARCSLSPPSRSCWPLPPLPRPPSSPLAPTSSPASLHPSPPSCPPPSFKPKP